ncbi:MAG: hypothetical protein JXR69_07965 [Candidatus Delongbacteria bacterium]|nr:hypothetical protein [Candidatus Delongbacteria bacterium]
MSFKYRKIFSLLFICFLQTIIASNDSLSLQLNVQHWYDNIDGQFEIENISYETQKREFKVEVELEISNSDQTTFRNDLTGSYEYDISIDPYDKSKVVDIDIETKYVFGISDLFSNKFDYSSYYRYKYEKSNSEYTEKNNLDIAPLGITYQFFKSDDIQELSISYYPVYNYYKYYQLDEYFLLLSAESKPEIEQIIQHNITFKFEATLFKNRIDISNETIYKHAQLLTDFFGLNDDIKDVYINNEFDIRYNLTNNLSLGYKYEFTKDDRLNRTHHQPSTNHTNSITLLLQWGDD